GDHRRPAGEAGGHRLVIAVLIAGGLAMLVALASTPLVIAYFRGHGLSQSIRDDVAVDHAETKAGTPTMGGTAILLAAVLGWAVSHVTELRFTPIGGLIVFVF